MPEPKLLAQARQVADFRWKATSQEIAGKLKNLKRRQQSDLAADRPSQQVVSGSKNCKV